MESCGRKSDSREFEVGESRVGKSLYGHCYACLFLGSLENDPLYLGAIRYFDSYGLLARDAYVVIITKLNCMSFSNVDTIRTTLKGDSDKNTIRTSPILEQDLSRGRTIGCRLMESIPYRKLCRLTRIRLLNHSYEPPRMIGKGRTACDNRRDMVEELQHAVHGMRDASYVGGPQPPLLALQQMHAGIAGGRLPHQVSAAYAD